MITFSLLHLFQRCSRFETLQETDENTSLQSVTMVTLYPFLGDFRFCIETNAMSFVVIFLSL